MSDKDFKVKNKLQVKGITSAGPVVSDASGNLDSTAYVATQYGGTGTTQSPNAGQIPYSSSGTNYTPTDLSSLTISSSGGSTITNNSASAVGLVIKGAASQTANLQEWQNSNGTALTKVDASGQITSTNGTQYGTIGPAGFQSGGSSGIVDIHYNNGNLTIRGGSAYISNTSLLVSTGYAGGIGQIIKGAASQTANLQEWQNSAGAIIASIGPVGDVAVNGSVYTNNAYFGGAASYYNATINIRPQQTSYKGIVIQGRASQTGNLQEWQDSAGTVLAKVSSAGKITVANDGEIASSLLLTSQALAGTVSVTTTSTANDYALTLSGTGAGLGSNVGMSFSAWGATGFNGVATPGAALWFTRTGSYSLGYLSLLTRTGTAQNDPLAERMRIGETGTISIAGFTASSVGLIVKASTSQTANLQEWQDSAGTVLGSIGAKGNISFTSTTTTAPSVEYVINASNSYPTFLVRTAAGSWINYVSASGTTMYNNTLIAANLANQIPLTVKGAASQTADLQQWQNSAGTVLAKIDKDGNFSNAATYGTITTTTLAATGGNITTTYGFYSNLPASTNAGIAVKPWAANIPGAIVRGYTSQTANLQEWQNSSGTVLASISAAGNLTVQDLTVNGTATTINSTTLTIDDKNIELASVASPTDTTADGAGITIKGATDKTFNWVQSTGSFTSSEPISTPALSVFGNSVSSNITLAAGKRYFVDTTAARTLTLPASPTLGDEIQVFDASGTAATYNITINSNSGKINGITGNLIIDTNGYWTSLVYTGSTYGWKVG